MYDELLSMLLALDGVQQDPRYHPERDALFHTLQVFQLARNASDDPRLWAAALFHDVGKAIDGPTHDEVGADLIDGLLEEGVVRLVRHHLDLLRNPRRARRRHDRAFLVELEALRRFDLGGRDPRAHVTSPEEALGLLLEYPALFVSDDLQPRETHEKELAR
jgi:hypothetical protein